MATIERPDPAPTPDTTDGNRVRDDAGQLDPRVRAALDLSEPGGQEPILLSEETRDVLTAAVREWQDDPPHVGGGVVPVLGAGVAAHFQRHSRDASANHSGSTSSKIDERR